MFNTDTIWFDVLVVTVFFLLGNIFLGHFEERSPHWKKLVKYMVTVTIIVLISIFAGRIYAFAILGLTLLPILYVHVVLLPRKGINGWTGEPKSKYYEFRGWSQDIFNTRTQDSDASQKNTR